MFVVFDTVNLYICVFMTCSTFCCLYDKLTDPWSVCVCMYVCIYACMHVCVYACMYVCTFLGRDMKLITRIYLMLRLRMRRAVPPFPMYTFMVCVGIASPFFCFLACIFICK